MLQLVSVKSIGKDSSWKSTHFAQRFHVGHLFHLLGIITVSPKKNVICTSSFQQCKISSQPQTRKNKKKNIKKSNPTPGKTKSKNIKDLLIFIDFLMSAEERVGSWWSSDLPMSFSDSKSKPCQRIDDHGIDCEICRVVGWNPSEYF